MSSFIKRFHGRNHVPGQLITAAELIEMQQLQYKTYCNIEADRYGLNPDGSFTPHVISGFTPSIVAGQQQIKIGRGHGWITNSLSNTDERIPIVLESDLYVDIPSGDATHPSWCHVMLECLTPGKNLAYGSVPVAVKGVDDVIRNISTPLYYQMTTATAILSEGTPAASPLCNVIGAPNQLPIATVYIPANFSGAVDVANLYDVRWFAPGHGTFNLNADDITTYETGTTTSSIKFGQFFESGGLYYFSVFIPNRNVFILRPQMNFTASGSVKAASAGDPLCVTCTNPDFGSPTVSSPRSQVAVVGNPAGYTSTDAVWITVNMTKRI